MKLTRKSTFEFKYIPISPKEDEELVFGPEWEQCLGGTMKTHYILGLKNLKTLKYHFPVRYFKSL